MRKLPWGIILGICAMGVFFMTVGFIAAYLVLNGVAGQTNETAGLFGEWYQTLMFVFDILFALGFGGALAMYVLRIKSEKTKEASDE